MPVEDPLYPVNLILAGRRCLVVGGGPVALQKITGLLEAEARVHVLDATISKDIREAAAADPRLTFEGARSPPVTWTASNS